jgi:hypothetical protein
LAPQEPQEAAKELARAVRERGVVAGMLPGVMSPMKGLGLPEFDPIYAMAEKLDVPLAVHSGPAVELGLEHVQSFAGVYPLSHPFAQMQQLTSMMIYGCVRTLPQTAGRVSGIGLRLGAVYGGSLGRELGAPAQSLATPDQAIAERDHEQRQSVLRLRTGRAHVGHGGEHDRCRSVALGIRFSP